MTQIFRFRNVKKMFEYQELENQEIHFSPLENLNDPMEGYFNLFFRGDRIAWENLFFHYVVCIDDTYCCMNYGIDVFAKDHEFCLRNYDEGYFSEDYGVSRKVICENAHRKLINLQEMKFFLKLVEDGQKISLLEMREYLKYIHLMVLHCYFEHCISIGSIKNEGTKNGNVIRSNMKSGFEGFETLCLDILKQKSSGVNFSEYLIARRCNDNINDLEYLFESIRGNVSRNNIYIFKEFPEKFLKQIESLLWDSHYIACFSEKPNNPTLWAHYADAHKGVCLIFNVQNGGLRLKTATSIGGTKSNITVGYDDVRFPLRKVRYEKRYPEVDFFKNLGTITRPHFSKYWCSNERGKSSSFEEYFKNNEQWMSNHYGKHDEIITTKLKDWEYENELRIIYENGIVDTRIPKNRSLKYSFELLDGMIFGINTSPEDKMKIIDIIREKCKQNNRGCFNFFQSFYDNSSGTIEKHPLKFSAM